MFFFYGKQKNSITESWVGKSPFLECTTTYYFSTLCLYQTIPTPIFQIIYIPSIPIHVCALCLTLFLPLSKYLCSFHLTTVYPGTSRISLVSNRVFIMYYILWEILHRLGDMLSDNHNPCCCVLHMPSERGYAMTDSDKIS